MHDMSIYRRIVRELFEPWRKAVMLVQAGVSDRRSCTGLIPSDVLYVHLAGAFASTCAEVTAELGFAPDTFASVA